MNTQNLGKLGEDIAARFLSSKGYLLLARNFRKSFGEIDIICRNADGILVFVEVKLVSGNSNLFLPEYHFNPAKRQKMINICRYFACSHPELVYDDVGWRIDLVALNLTHGSKRCVIRHYQNV